MEQLKIQELYSDLSKTMAKELLESKIYPWEVLPEISAFLVKLGNALSEEEYEKRGEDVWIAKSAKVAPTAYIHGPAIIGKEAEVRHCAFIRGNALVGEGAVVGNSTELKNVILFDKVQVPHYNYVGDKDHAITRIAPVKAISLKPSTIVFIVSSNVMIWLVRAITIPVTAIPKEPQ